MILLLIVINSCFLGLLKCLSLELLLLSLDLGSSLVVVAQVASLAHTHRVKKSVVMLAVKSILVSAELAVAGRTHVFGVVFTGGMRALSEGHYVRFLAFFTQLTAGGGLVVVGAVLLRMEFDAWFTCWFFAGNFFLFIDKFFLDEIL